MKTKTVSVLNSNMFPQQQSALSQSELFVSSGIVDSNEGLETMEENILHDLEELLRLSNMFHK